MLGEALAPKQRQFIFFADYIPYREFKLGHRLHQSSPLRMILGKRQQTSARLDVLKRN
jgi:hypothetical protein